ncbi:hypothetical protein [Clostridium paraputrificum]|uniref:hypothetical protein n=1 Tax=Clostridium paraputrificum TaxID=29363 RepID=UPI00040A5060|nr:hypothetical protein [Clostridium paraputrificum]
MNELMSKLYNTKETKTTNFGKEEQIGFSLQAKHLMVKKLNKRALSICMDSDYYVYEDCVQEVAFVIIKAAKTFVETKQATMEHLIDNIYNYEDETLCKFWGYASTVLERHIRNELKHREKRAAEDILGGKVDYLLFSTIEDKTSLEDATAAEIIDNFLFNKSKLYEGEDTSNPFVKWFNENKEEILTKQQLQFINAGGIGYRKDNAYHYKKNIAKRALSKYAALHSTSNLKKIELDNNIEILEELLNGNFYNALKEYIDEDVVVDIIYSNKTSVEDKKNITNFIHGKVDILNLDTTIKLTLLFQKKLGELEYKLWLKQNIA